MSGMERLRPPEDIAPVDFFTRWLPASVEQDPERSGQIAGTEATLVFVLEGAIYTLFPDGMKRIMAHTLTLPVSALRGGGLTAACVGMAALWFIRS